MKVNVLSKLIINLSSLDPFFYFWYRFFLTSE